MQDLTGKTVVVTGAAKGIGRAIAVAFAKEKCNIVVNYHSTEPKETIDLCEAEGVKVLALQGDVSDFNFAKDFINQAKKEFGSVDVLVNNAGITRDTLLLGMKENDFDDVINTNLKGTFNMIKFASKIMLKQKSGSIINMASVVGVTGNAGQANYAASKAGVIGLTKSVAKELASRGVTANAIAPGFIETDMTAVLTDEQKAEIFKGIPLARGGKPEEVAEATVFLAKHKYITGQVLNVDGGMVI